MTLAEIERYIASKLRQKKIEQQEKASFDYIHAELVGRSIARIYSSSANYPHIGDVYTTLFDNEEVQQQKQERKNELSALRFKQFTETFNNKFKG